MKKIITLLTMVFMLAMSCVAFAATDISSGSVQAEGYGNPNQLVGPGYRAAKIDAMRNLLEAVHNVQIDSKTVVEYNITTLDVIDAKINGVLNGAREVKRWQDADGGYHMIVEMGLYGGAGSLADVIVPQVQQVPLPEPSIFQNTTTTTTTSTTTAINSAPVDTYSPVVPVTAPVRGNYTGLIVDCTGLGLSTAMAPGIYSENQSVVYGLQHVSHEQVISRGYVGYSNGMSNVSRAGSNPLIVKATGLRDHAIRPVISDADAMTVLSENKATGFLNNGNVVFMR